MNLITIYFCNNFIFGNDIRYYAKVRKSESLFYKTNICLRKTTTCIGLQVEQILFVNI